MNSLQNKFSACNDWLVTAILEKILNRVPTKDELAANLKIQFNETTHENKIFYGNRLILTSIIRSHDNVIHGDFGIPEQFIDDIIIDRVANWSK
jgi:hypothetical protein